MITDIVPIVGRGTSLSDFGTSSCRIVYTGDCNLRCPYCSQACFLSENKPDTMDYLKVINDITRDKRWCDRIVISGGEPTIHKSLPVMVRQFSYHNGFYVKLDTNGTNPDILRACIENLDDVCVDIKTSLHKYNLLGATKDYTNRILDTVQLLMKQEKINYSFRITLVPSIVTEEDITFIGNLVRGAPKIILRQFEPQFTYSSHFRTIEPFNRGTIFKFRSILKDYVTKVEFDNVIFDDDKEKDFVI